MASANLNDCLCLSPDSLAADSGGLPINKPLKSRLGKISWQHVLWNMLTSQEKAPCSLLVKLAIEQIAFTVCTSNIDFLPHTIILLWFHLKSDHSDWNQNKSLWIEQLGFALRTPICLFFLLSFFSNLIICYSFWLYLPVHTHLPTYPYDGNKMEHFQMFGFLLVGHCRS